MLIQENLRANIMGVFGARGAAWLDTLPVCLESLARKWRLRIEPPFPDLSFNYVAPATDEHGGQVVVKAGVPCTELKQEIAALRLFRGRGSVRLLRSDVRLGAMLLERLDPGTTLDRLNDDEAETRIAAECMLRMRLSLDPGHSIPSIRQWAGGFTRMRERFAGGTGPLPVEAVERAEGLFADLFASCGEEVLLHADLHHYNILRDGDGWRVIDPKGMAGEPAYECGAWLRNPGDLLSRPNVRELLTRRIAIFSEMLGFEQDRIRAWAYAQAILSAWWGIEDNSSGWDDSLTVAHHLLS